MNIGLTARVTLPHALTALSEAASWLDAHGCTPIVEREAAGAAGIGSRWETEPLRALPERVDVILAFGGDGTLLSVAGAIANSSTDIPVLGINLGRLGFLTEVGRTELTDLAKSRMAVQASGEKKAGAAFLEKEAAQPGSKRQPSGFLYKETKAGTGSAPRATDTVKVHYKGTLTDGTVFDSSEGKDPVTFPLNQVIPCWTQGLQLMKEGGTARLVCPSDLAYGDDGRPPRIKGGSTLVFDVQLISVEKNAPPAAAAPAPKK